MAFVSSTCCANWMLRNYSFQESAVLTAFPGLRISKSVCARFSDGVSNRRNFLVTMAVNDSVLPVKLDPFVPKNNLGIPIMMNGCTGKMGRAIVEAAISAGLDPVPVALGGPNSAGKIVEVSGKRIEIHGPSDAESVLSSVYKENPGLIVVDYTTPAAVDANAALYCKVGVPFVMGTTGGDRELLYKTVNDSKVYALISPQMGKQVVGFLASMEFMARSFPGLFSSYILEVTESHQASKLDLSGTAKEVISCLQKMGASFTPEQLQQVRDPKLQVEMMGVPEEHVLGHAYHTYRLKSPDGTVSLGFEHNVCGRSIYVEGTIDAILFLAKKVRENAEKRLYTMIDVLLEGKP